MSKVTDALSRYPRSTKIGIIGLVAIVIAIAVWQNVREQIFPDDPLISAGADVKLSLAPDDVSYSFEDPLKTPSSVHVYPVYAAPEKLFSEDAVVAIAANIGFTDRASAQQATRGYIYTESGSTLSFDVIGGTLTYSVPQQNHPTANQTISIDAALTQARDFVTKIGFANPLYVWSIDNIRLYTQAGDTLTDATFVDAQTHYHVIIPMQIGNAPLYFPQEQYIKVHADGSVIGAFLWYPFVDLSRPENVAVIEYADATTKVRLGEARYTVGRLTTETTLSSSTIGYIIPDGFMQRANEGGFITEPAYVFSNEDVTIYIGAMK